MGFLNALPGAVGQGLIWGVMAIGVYITFRVLDFADLTVDGTLATGGAAMVMSLMAGCNVYLALLIAFVAGCLAVAGTVGKIGIECLVGYGLCSLSAAVALCATMTLLVTRKEEKNYERKF